MAVAGQTRGAVARPRRTSTKKETRGRGTGTMKTAADQTLQGNCAEVTDQLLWSTLGGNAVSARLLFALADGQIDIADVVAGDAVVVEEKAVKKVRVKKSEK